MEPQRPQISPDEFERPLGSDMPERPPLPLLPEREWLKAVIKTVKYQVAMFNNQVQYVTDKDDNPILDENGNQIMRKEFEISFELPDYQLANGEPRKQWLRVGASMGEKAHLPVLLLNVLGDISSIETPADVVSALTGKKVRLQVANKPNRKDPTKQPYQNVVYDAVKGLNVLPPAPPVQPITGHDVAEDVPFPPADANDDEVPW